MKRSELAKILRLVADRVEGLSEEVVIKSLTVDFDGKTVQLNESLVPPYLLERITLKFPVKEEIEEAVINVPAIRNVQEKQRNE